MFYYSSSAFFFSASTSAKGFDVVEVFNEDAISILLSCLKDSYEHNKMVAFDLLMAVPPQCLPFQVCSNLISNRLIGDSIITTAKFVPCCICTVSIMIRPAHALIGQKPMFYQM